MRRYTMLIALVFALGLLTAACGGGSSNTSLTPQPTKMLFTPSPGNSELVVGKNRIAVGVVDDKNKPVLGDPGNSVQIQFKGAYGYLIGSPENATFVDAIAKTRGYWVLNHVFTAAGNQPAVMTIRKGARHQAIDVTFVVTQTGNAPTIGQAAPPTDNPTLSTQPNKKQITTDSKPNDAFYQLTVRQALDARKPFVVIFATPAFCQSALCGPVLDNVKSLQPQFAGRVNFIHIEPYVLDAKGSLENNKLTANQPTTDWHLQSEPWVFVVGADGKITDRFEGTASPTELRQAIQADLG